MMMERGVEVRERSRRGFGCFGGELVRGIGNAAGAIYREEPKEAKSIEPGGVKPLLRISRRRVPSF